MNMKKRINKSKVVAAIVCGILASILGASTRSIGDRAYGYMVLGIPGGVDALTTAVSYLSGTPDITVQIEAEYAGKEGGDEAHG